MELPCFEYVQYGNGYGYGYGYGYCLYGMKVSGIGNSIIYGPCDAMTCWRCPLSTVHSVHSSIGEQWNMRFVISLSFLLRPFSAPPI